MGEERKEFVVWVKVHKKELIIAGISIGTVIVLILGIKNRDSLMKLWDTLIAALDTEYTSGEKIICKPQDTVSVCKTENLPRIQVTETEKINGASFAVSDHIRNLHPGWNASAKKLAEAEALDIILLPGQTLVDKYTKRSTVA